MSELLPVLEGMLGEVQAGRRCVLCSVVSTKGSTPQAAGATLLLREDLTTLGTLGGGCVEAEVVKRAWRTLAAGTGEIMEFVLDHDYGWDDGLICGGSMQIACMPVTAQLNLQPYSAALEQARARQIAAFPVRVAVENAAREYRITLEVPPRLIIAGAGHVSQALARLAAGLDFEITVIDDRADYAAPARFPAGVNLITRDIAAALRAQPLDHESYVVIVTRGHQHDYQALEAVVESEAGYIGMIGSKRKIRMIYDDLKERGVASEKLERVHSPIGLSINAVTVPEIAVSIAAQLIEHRRRNKGKLVEGPLPAERGDAGSNSSGRG